MSRLQEGEKLKTIFVRYTLTEETAKFLQKNQNSTDIVLLKLPIK
jgi:hypothetical protein